MASTNGMLLLLLSVVSILLTSIDVVSSDEAKTLIKFKESLSNNSALSNWNESISLCGSNVKANWNGILCRDGKFVGLKLEGMGLSGQIDVETLAELPALRSLSLMNNNFEGAMPSIDKLGSLHAFYISNNKFSGKIRDDAFSGTRSLKKVYLANNEFVGEIPKSLGKLGKLLEVHLEGNEFEGPIPSGLSNQDPSSFAGNLNLCGKPLNNTCPPSKKRKLSKSSIIIIVVILTLLLVIATSLYYLYKSAKNKTKANNDLILTVNSDSPTKDGYNNNKKSSEKSPSGKLNFVRNDRERFDLQDMLTASAEVLGSGNFGSSYKAELLLGGAAFVVKRYRNQMSNVGKVEFYQYMRKLGSLSHPNVLPLLAFYYKKDEKLLISDFAHNGSLASHLHGKKSGLNWATRLKIIKGVAMGLDYLNKELQNLSIVPHGHLKSTNVLLDSNYEAVLADYGLIPIVNKQDAQNLMSAYKSPEFGQCSVITIKSDVWCLGILILEVLTGIFPANFLTQVKGENVDLARWVNSVVREEWTGEVFDKEMKGREKGEGEMLKLLKIGMCCCEEDVEKRWDLEVAVLKIQELKEREIEDENQSEDDNSFHSSVATLSEDFSFYGVK